MTVYYTLYSKRKKKGRIYNLKQEFFNRIEIMKDTPHSITLTYYLLESNISEEYCDLKIYGVLVEKESTTKNGRKVRERKSIPDLFFTKGDAKQFLERIYEQRIMPIDLKYAVKPYVEEQMGIRNVESV